MNGLGLEDVYSFVAKLVFYGGGTVALSFLSFRFLLIKWIQSKFDQQMQNFRHQQAVELANLKVKIDSSLSASIKLQEREFSLLPDAWTKLHAAYKSCIRLADPNIVSIDLEKLDHDQFQDFLHNYSIGYAEEAQIRIAVGIRKRTFLKFYIPRLIQESESSVAEFADFMAANGIFFPRNLKETLRIVAMRLQNHLRGFKTAFAADDVDGMKTIYRTLCDEVSPLHEALEEAIEQRLKSHATA